MADEDENGIDPRYDPVFQRGYRGATAEAPAPRRPPPDIAGPTAREPAAKVPIVRQPAASVVPAGVADIDDDTQSNPDADGVEGDAASPDDILPPLRANPYVYALGIMGILFVVAGIGVEVVISSVTFSRNGFESTSVSFLIAQNVGYMLTGPLITVGLAILAGLVFFAGSRWRLRRDRKEQ